jgi:hypothetical protein
MDGGVSDGGGSMVGVIVGLLQVNRERGSKRMRKTKRSRRGKESVALAHRFDDEDVKWRRQGWCSGERFWPPGGVSGAVGGG